MPERVQRDTTKKEKAVLQLPVTIYCKVKSENTGRTWTVHRDDMQSLEHRDHRDLLMASSSYQSTGGRAIIAPTMAMARLGRRLT